LRQVLGLCEFAVQNGASISVAIGAFLGQLVDCFTKLQIYLAQICTREYTHHIVSALHLVLARPFMLVLGDLSARLVWRRREFDQWSRHGRHPLVMGGF
jgi:hypothetical protein